MNGLPRQSNQNRMIPFLFRKKLLEVKHAAYCTTVSLRRAHNLRTDSHRDTISAATHCCAQASWSPELSDAEYRRESRQALTGSSANKCTKGEDYSEFLICRVGRTARAVSVWVQRNAALARQAVEGKKVGRGAVGFCSCGLLPLVSPESRPALASHWLSFGLEHRHLLLEQSYPEMVALSPQSLSSVS